jgi:lambda family phage portal protein
MANYLDNIIRLVSPKAALQREQYRRALDMVRKYDAASLGRRTDGWHATGTDANQEIRGSLHRLVDRSRELGRNNPYAKKAINVIANNTIGTGIRATPIAEGKAQLKKAKSEWKKWSESTKCDFDGRRTFYGIQRMAMRSIAEGGEVLIRIRWAPKERIPIQLQLLEGDFLDMSKDLYVLQGGGRIINGVEFDENGRRVAYWLYEDHPGSSYGNLVSNRIPADEIIHVYEELRVGQVRGVPFGVSAMMRLRDFDLYEDAQLLRQQIAACFSVFVTDINAVATPSSVKPELTEKVEPGIIQRLAAGEQVSFASPPGAEGYSDYSRNVLQAIAAGYGIPYEALTGNLKDVNFSSGRMGWLEFARQVQDWQENMLIPQLCQPIWDAFLRAGDLRGVTREDWAVTWTAPRREMIDPLKETEAIQMQVENGLIDWGEAVRQQGYDPDEVMEAIKMYGDKFDSMKIKVAGDFRNTMEMKKKVPSGGQAPAAE